MMLKPEPRRVRVTIVAEINRDVDESDVLRDIENELGASIYLSSREVTDVEIIEPYVPSARITWRGSVASAQMIEDYVNLIDSVPHRAGTRSNGRGYARADADFDTLSDGYGSTIRSSAMCVVDAYDGRHTLFDGDVLVAIDGGWTVEPRA